MPYTKYCRYLNGERKKPRSTAYRHKLIDNLDINQQKPIDLIINNQTNYSEEENQSADQINRSTSDIKINENSHDSDFEHEDKFEQSDINEDFVDAACSVSNYEDLCATFLCLFYSSGINKTQLEICLDLMKIRNVITYKQIPKSFSECSKVILDKMGDSVDYEKQWYCCTCKKFIVLESQHQRTCKTCSNKSDS
jgi:hypothetical protein